jgi:hypothetical protein
MISAGTRTFWTPVRDFQMGFELSWTNHHTSHADGVVYAQPVISGFKPNAQYEIRDQNVFSGFMTVRRFFCSARTEASNDNPRQGNLPGIFLVARILAARQDCCDGRQRRSVLHSGKSDLAWSMIRKSLPST